MKKQQPHDRRETILSVALQLFTERGYFNTSVHDIQKLANVSIGSIYHHFGNKEAIAKALFLDIENSLNEAITGIMLNHRSCHDRCRSVISYLFETTEKNQQMMKFMLYAKHQEFMPDEKPVCSSRPFSLMKDMVIDGMKNGELRVMDPSVAAVAVFGAPLRLLFLRMDGVLEKPLPLYLEECWDCVWRGIQA